jgi:hypothetical protein
MTGNLWSAHLSITELELDNAKRTDSLTTRLLCVCMCFHIKSLNLLTWVDGAVSARTLI